ncbi:hypothetical protein JAAARDRAFT_43015 [Jaapia argillacea MUCL 33604]|uniref:Uncharacterized protein n=1 Tax=Jaapia argillacea MUCL 33604 TaxID=933084 RepID=A0A067PFG4_9AGAM|nr:hypothetical protein JAAARDRAFT_43015 [Jaapia argillacea MUCL 33604]
MNRFRKHKHKRRLTLDNLPPEICEQIIAFACIDGGFTASSLALTSKYISGTSGGSRFYSVSVSGLERINNLLEALRSGNPQSRGVEHMYLSYVTPTKQVDVRPVVQEPRPWTRRLRQGLTWTSAETKAIQEPNPTPPKPPAEATDRYCPKVDLISAISTATTAILALTCSTLVTLTIVIPQTASFILSLGFPLLEELSFYCLYSNEYEWEISTNYRLSALRRLHLAGSEFSERDIRRLLKISPGLTHLRLSEVDGSVDLESALRGLVGGPEDQINQDLYGIDLDSPLGRHPSLETIVIQPRFELHDALQRLKQEAFWVEVALLQWRYLPNVKLEDEGRVYWEERVAGREGCWNIRGEVLPDANYSARLRNSPLASPQLSTLFTQNFLPGL